jgi:M6 family metalloprotease-like protein
MKQLYAKSIIGITSIILLLILDGCGGNSSVNKEEVKNNPEEKSLAQPKGILKLKKFTNDFNLTISKEYKSFLANAKFIIPLDINGDNQDEILVYEPNSHVAKQGKGLVQIYKITTDNTLELLKQYTNWSDNIDMLFAIDIDGDKKNELIAYTKFSSLTDNTHALGEIYNISNEGDLTLLKRYTNWYQNWDKLVAIDLDGDNRDELFAYAKYHPSIGKNSALGDFYDISNEGNITIINRYTNLSKNWDILLSSDIDGDNKDELITFSQNSPLTDIAHGMGEIYKVSDNGTMSLLKRHTNWYKRWSQLIFADINNDNKDELIAYAKSSSLPENDHALGDIYTLSNDGNPTLLKRFTTWNSNLDNIAIIKKTGSDLLLSYAPYGNIFDIVKFRLSANESLATEPKYSKYTQGVFPFEVIKLKFSENNTSNHTNNNLNKDALEKLKAYYLEISEGRFSLKGDIFEANLNQSCTGHGNLTEWRLFALNQAVEQGFKIEDFDKDNNKFIDPNELGLYFSTNCGAGPNDVIAVVRENDGDVIDTQGNVLNYFEQSASGGANVNLKTIAHELSHLYGGAFDFYPNNKAEQEHFNYNTATLMGITASINFNTLLTHQDPFHRLIFGWLKPRIFDVSTMPLSKIEIALTRGGIPVFRDQSPIILYDSKRGYNNFFIIEYRKASSFDIGTSENGIAIWKVTRNKDGKYKRKDVLSLIKPTDAERDLYWDENNTQTANISFLMNDGQNLPLKISDIKLFEDKAELIFTQ